MFVYSLITGNPQNFSVLIPGMFKRLHHLHALVHEASKSGSFLVSWAFDKIQCSWVLKISNSPKPHSHQLASLNSQAQGGMIRPGATGRSLHLQDGAILLSSQRGWRHLKVESLPPGLLKHCSGWVGPFYRMTYTVVIFNKLFAGSIQVHPELGLPHSGLPCLCLCQVCLRGQDLTEI